MTALLDPPLGAPPPDPAPRKPASSTPAAGRIAFLDTVRSIALLRVIVWHTFATAAISWVVASMPAMFFVAGSLLAGSLDRKPLRALMHDRLRRLLVPFWTFGGVVLTVLVVVHQLRGTEETRLSPAALPAWIFPLLDPHGSEWEAGWASTPLWYLRCYLWLLLLSPLLLRAFRRHGLRILLVPLTGVVVVDWLIRNPGAAPPGFASAKWYLGDLTTYSFFLVLGFAHHDGRIRSLDRRGRLEWAAIGGMAALIWVTVVAVPETVVNNSYPLLLFVGLAWLAVFLAAEPWLTGLAAHPRAAPVIRFLGRRSITVYLWHPVAIVGAYWIRSKVAPDIPRIAVLPVVVLLVLGLTLLFGRVEDRAAGRPPQWWPGRDLSLPARVRRVLDVVVAPVHRSQPAVAVVSGLAVGALTLGVLVPSQVPGDGASASTRAGSEDAGGGLALPPAPSGKPDVANFGDATDGATGAVATGSGAATGETGTGAASGGTSAATAGEDVSARVVAAIDAWRGEKDVDGARIGISFPDGSIATVASGKGPGGGLGADDEFPITSITKTMTAAIMLQLVAEGEIGLDDQLPEVRAVPGLPWVGKVTIRQLLNHTAGVKPYDQTGAYESASSKPLTPVAALQLSATEPLEWAPGTQGGYSNSGFLTLGLLEEQLTGKSYDTLLTDRVFSKAGMADSRLDTAPTAGWAGFSAGGVVSTTTDLVRWGAALYRDGTVLQPEQGAVMLDVANQFSAGLGAFPVCPCSTTDGEPVYSSIGHNGGESTLQYSPSDDLVIAASLTESMWTDQLTQADVADLLARVRSAVATG